MLKYPCIKGCARCCYHVPWEEDGTPCEILDVETGLCRLYDVDGVDLRPPVCSVRGVFERRILPDRLATWPQFISLNSLYCNLLIDAAVEDGELPQSAERIDDVIPIVIDEAGLDESPLFPLSRPGQG